MKYYLMNWEESGNPVPRIRNWSKQLDYHAVQKRQFDCLPNRSILHIEENPHTVFADLIETPFLLMSEMVWDVAKTYGACTKGRQMVLLDGVNGFAEIYYMPLLKPCSCLSESTVFNNDHSVIHRLVMDKKKEKQWLPVFRVAEMEKDYVIGRLDFVESILRRGAKGIRLTELVVE